jgi:DNA-binding MarR family transcriptional regulator
LGIQQTEDEFARFSNLPRIFSLIFKLNASYTEKATMSMGSRDNQTKIGEKLVSELRQSYGLGVSFFRAAAARIEMTDTDMHVIDLLESTGEATAGQLAQLMGLTTGTFTAILKRLEKAGLVRRERDPNDGRRVIVRLATGSDSKQEPNPLFASLGKAWEEMAAHYDDEQKRLLLEFLQRSNALAKEEIARLRAAPAANEGIFSAPLLALESARLVVHAEGIRLSLRGGDLAGALYQARFEGLVPEVKLKDGVVAIRYPRRLWVPDKEKRVAEITLSSAIPWQIALKGGGAEMTAELGELSLLELEANGAGSMFHIVLPEPTRVVPMRLGGSGSQFTVRRPPGAAARVQGKGWGSGVVFDDQMISGMSSDAGLQSPNYEGAVLRYEIETSGSGSMITITTA